jgi:hypothetical protein
MMQVHQAAAEIMRLRADNERLTAALNTIIYRHINDPDVQAYELVAIASHALGQAVGDREKST